VSAPPAPAANPHVPTVLKGLAAAPSAAAIVLSLSFFGFGAFARDLGLEAWQLVAMAVSTWALPSLVIFIVSMAAGAGPFAAAFAVAVSALRLLPMTIALMPYLSTEGLKRRWLFLATHFVAVTSYVEGLARLPAMAPERRTSWFIGFCAGVMALATTSGVVGYHVAGATPKPIAIGLVFMTPMYFICGMATTAASRHELLALALGFVLGPALMLVVPEFSLALAGAIGGTLAYALRRLTPRATP
jgi:predicted branched-subunit amino acid permease